MKKTSRKGAAVAGEPANLHWISNQAQVQPVSVWTRANLSGRFAYSPSAESCAQSEPGQDFAAIASDGKEARFVLCDGVSLSYRGDFGARILGEGLFDWLKRSPRTDPDRIDRLLEDLSHKAEKGLEKLALPEELSPLVRDVLLEKRRSGTEAMFACGHLVVPRQGREGRLWLMWQGDIRIRLWSGQSERFALPPEQFKTADRWSSRAEKAGAGPFFYSSRLPNREAGGLLIYSDGLQLLDGKDIPLPERELSKALFGEDTDGLSDDGSFLELSWNKDN